MDRILPTAIVVAVILLSFVGMIIGWRSRQRRQRSIGGPLPVPAEIGHEILSTELLYVATTIAGDPLDRVAVAGLGYPGQAICTVFTNGIVLAIAGVPEFFIPSCEVRAVDRATWTIDRVVESGGLVRICWLMGETEVDSYLRVVQPPDPSALIAAVQQIAVGVADQEGIL